jgi:hypothetical protein
MSYTPPPNTVSYIVRINLGEPNVHLNPVTAARSVAHNILAGRDADVEFKDAVDIEQVREKFQSRIADAMKELDQIGEFWCEPAGVYWHYRLRK